MDELNSEVGFSIGENPGVSLESAFRKYNMDKHVFTVSDIVGLDVYVKDDILTYVPRIQFPSLACDQLWIRHHLNSGEFGIVAFGDMNKQNKNPYASTRFPDFESAINAVLEILNTEIEVNSEPIFKARMEATKVNMALVNMQEQARE